MGNLNRVSDAASAANIYVDRLIVFVEGKKDVDIFRRLFPNKEEEIQFQTRDTSLEEIVGEPEKGCLAVIDRVSQERDDRFLNPDRVIGFVDRDIFFAREEWDILFEQDDQKYRNASTLGDGILPLIYWEIENYLLNPEVVATVLELFEKRNLLEVKNKLHTAIDRSMYLSAANCVTHCHRVQAIAHGIVLNECDEAEFKKLIKQQATKRLGLDFSNDQFEAFYKRYVEFLEGVDKDARLERAMRIIPGKTLISYIVKHYNLREKMERSLAEKTENSNKIHMQFVHDIEERLTS